MRSRQGEDAVVDPGSLSRRSILRWAGSAAGAVLAKPATAWMGERSGGDRVLVHVFLAGGWDSTGLLAGRDTDATGAALGLGFEPLARWFERGLVAVVTGVGAENGDRLIESGRIHDELPLQYLPGAAAAPLWAARAAGIEGIDAQSGWASWEGLAVVTPGQPRSWDSAAFADAAISARVDLPFPDTAPGRTLERAFRAIGAGDQLGMGSRVVSIILNPGAPSRQLEANLQLSAAFAAFAEACERSGKLSRTLLYTDTECGRVAVQNRGHRSVPVWAATRIVLGGEVLGGRIAGGEVGTEPAVLREEFDEAVARWLGAGASADRPNHKGRGANRLRFVA